MTDIQRAALGAFCLGAIVGVSLCAFGTHAQAPVQAPSETQQFAGLAGMALTKISELVGERDAARAQLAACQASTKPPEPVKP